MKTKEKIDLMYEAFTTKKRDNGEDFYLLKDGSPQWMTDVVHAVHGDTLPDDTIYKMIYDALSTLTELDEEAEEDKMRDAIYSMEPDVYTSNLTAWINKRNNHVYYLTEALEEFDIKDGFQALSMAQKMQMDEIGDALIIKLQEDNE